MSYYIDIPPLRPDQLDTCIEILQQMKLFVEQTNIPPIGSIVKIVSRENSAIIYRKVARCRVRYSEDTRRPYIKLELIAWHMDVDDCDKYAQDVYLHSGDPAFLSVSGQAKCVTEFSEEEISLLLTDDSQGSRRLGEMLYKQLHETRKSS
jgi:hypothetical protein